MPAPKSKHISLTDRLKPGAGPYEDLGDDTNCRPAFNSTVSCRISSAEVNIKGNACKLVSICSWRKEGDLSLDLCYFSRMLPVQANRYKMKKRQTDGERNTTNSAGDCIQGQPAPMFSKLGTFCWKLSPWPFLHEISICVNSYYRGSRSDATFPIFQQHCISWSGTGLSVSSWDLSGPPWTYYLCMGKSDKFHGHFLLLKLHLCISNTEMPCSKNLACDKVRVFLR